MSVSMLGHQFFAFQQIEIVCVPGGPVAGVVCAQIMDLPPSVWSMKVRPVGHAAGTQCAGVLASSWLKFQVMALTKQ